MPRPREGFGWLGPARLCYGGCRWGGSGAAMEQYTPGTFGRLAQWVMRHPRQALAVIAIACVLSAAFASRVRVNANILALLPDDDPVTQAIQRLNDEEGGSNVLTISIQGQDPEKLDAFMDDLSDEVSQLDNIDYVLHDIDPELAWQLGVLQLTPAELTTIRDKLNGALALGPAIQNPLIASRVLALGPLTDKLAQADARDLMALERDDIRQLIIRPTMTAYEPAFSRPFMAQIYDLLDEMEPEARGVRVAWVGGAYRHSVEEVEGIIQDLSFTALLSFALVTLVVGVSFRDFRAVLLIFTPLLLGNLLTWGFAGVAVGTVTSFTSFFTAVLIGLGVDFSIHLYARYREERAQHADLEEAVARAWDATGPPCTTAAVTSAGGFLSLWIASFEGFQQLGTLLAGGVLLCLVSVLVVLPLLIRWREGHAKDVPLPKLIDVGSDDDAAPRYRLAPVGLLALGLLTALAATQLTSIDFEYDISMMRQRGTAYDQLDETQQYLVETSFAPIVISYDSMDEMLADYQIIQPAVAADKLTFVERVVSIYSVLPPDQQRRVDLLGEIAVLARSDSARYLPRQVQDNLSRLLQGEPRVLAASGLPRGLQHVLGVADGRQRMMLMPRGNMWDMRNDILLQEELEQWLPGRPIASEFLASGMLYRLISVDGPRIAWLALLTIFAITLVDLRKPGRAIGAVAAVAVGMCWAGAGMAIFGVKLSLINFAAIPILMGIGVDIVIHLLHRLAEEGPGKVTYTLSTTGWASLLSTVTTIVSFSALLIATNQGVQSLGTLVVLGLAMVTIAAFASVPLGWMMTWKIRGDLDD